MSSITINGKDYDLDAVLMSAELNHLLYLKQKANLGMKTMLRSLQQLEKTADQFPTAPVPEDASDEEKAEGARAKAEADRLRGEAFLGEFEDEGVLNAFRAIVWLARTKAGDRDPESPNTYLTIDAANEGVSLFNMVGSTDVSEDEIPDPKDEAPETAEIPS